MLTRKFSPSADAGQYAITAYKFLDFIFSPHNGQRGYVEFRYYGAGHPAKIAGAPDYLQLPLDEKAIEEKILPNNGERMITVGVAPRIRIPKKGKPAGAGDIDEVSCIWANLDYDSTPGGTIEVIQRISDLELRPSMVVNTGYGRRVFYCFTEPFRDDALLNWTELVFSLRYMLGSRAPIDISQTIELPGALNIRYEQPVLCQIHEEKSSWLRYSKTEVADFLSSVPKKVKSATSTAPKVSWNELNVSLQNLEKFEREQGIKSVNTPSVDAMRERGISAKLINSIITGDYETKEHQPKSSKDFQSERDVEISAALLSRNFTESEVAAVFRTHPGGCGNVYAKADDGESYLTTVIGKAAAKAATGFVKRGAFKLLDEFGEHSMPPGYELREDGAIWEARQTRWSGKEPVYTLVSSSPIRISEIYENIDTGQISVGISYRYLDRTRKTVITRAQMCNTRSLTMALSDEGAPITANNARLVVGYLSAYEHAFSAFIPRKKVTSKLGRGRSGKSFFLPGVSKEIEFAPQGTGDAVLYRAFASRCGRLSEWLEVMNTLESRKLMIPQIAVTATFVPPLQRILQIPNFIIDIFGNSSSGKSTTLKLAASVFGRPHEPESLILQWMNTRNGIEQVAGMCSELPIFLDDAQHCPDSLKRDIIYMIANGKGKARGRSGGGIKETNSWHTVALSTSEEPLHASSPHEGARGRLLPVGGIKPPFPPNSGGLVNDLEHAVSENHGYAGEIFIRHINDWDDKTWMKWQRRYIDLRNELRRESSSDIVGRVSGYIASIGVAGEIAAPLLGLRFQPDVLCAWLLNHLQEQQSAQNQVFMALRILADHFMSNKNQFAGTENFNASRASLQGSIQQDVYVCFLRKTIDKAFAAKKWNSWTILNKMAEAEVIHCAEKNRHTKKIRVEGFAHRMVCVKWSALFPDD